MQTFGAFAFVLLILIVGGNGLFPASTTTVLEAKCKVNESFNEEKRCITFAGAGATFALTVNTTTQQVLLEVTKSDGNWFMGAYFLDGCKVVDARNWECTDKTTFTGGSWTQLYGTVNGQFYRSFTSTGTSTGADFYSSGISGWRYWLVYLGLATPEQAVKCCFRRWHFTHN
jgi:hypothetical protein